MLKQGLIYLVLSILIIVFAEYAHLAIVYIDMFYTWIIVKLNPIFSVSNYGILMRNVFSLVLIPIILAGIPALIYRAIKGRPMPYFVVTTWVLWLIIVLSKILIK